MGVKRCRECGVELQRDPTLCPLCGHEPDRDPAEVKVESYHSELRKLRERLRTLREEDAEPARAP